MGAGHRALLCVLLRREDQGLGQRGSVLLVDGQDFKGFKWLAGLPGFRVRISAFLGLCGLVGLRGLRL